MNGQNSHWRSETGLCHVLRLRSRAGTRRSRGSRGSAPRLAVTVGAFHQCCAGRQPRQSIDTGGDDVYERMTRSQGARMPRSHVSCKVVAGRVVTCTASHPSVGGGGSSSGSTTQGRAMHTPNAHTQLPTLPASPHPRTHPGLPATDPGGCGPCGSARTAGARRHRARPQQLRPPRSTTQPSGPPTAEACFSTTTTTTTHASLRRRCPPAPVASGDFAPPPSAR